MLKILQRLEYAAASRPHNIAVYAQQVKRSGKIEYAAITFDEFAACSRRFGNALRRAGIGRGSRVLLMVRPSLNFAPLVFALFRIGAIPVLIDPGMGWRGFANCVRQVAPQAFIGIPQAHLIRHVFRHSFDSVNISLTLGPRGFPGAPSLEQLARRENSSECPASVLAADDSAAILFTSGSTGPAKGVLYTHRVFETQLDLLETHFGLSSTDIDLPCFPLFGLFSSALGITAVIPDMDFTRPANVDPMRIIKAVQEHKATYSFGSPALWRTVSRFCSEHGVRLTGLQRVFMAGAPVPAELHRHMLEHVLPEDGEVVVPYGATEALPVATFTGTEMLADTRQATGQGKGVCVGKPVKDIRVAVIDVTDKRIQNWDTSLEVTAGEIGELTVKGPMVTREYYNRPEQTALAKIYEGDSVWHRMGDLGYIDSQGRIWVCGRKSQRVETAEFGRLYTVCCEAVFNTHPEVYRTALVGVGEDRYNQIPVLVVEPEPGRFPKNRQARQAFRSALLKLGQSHQPTKPVRHVLFRRHLPVDVRHNAKIGREELSRWAASRI